MKRARRTGTARSFSRLMTGLIAAFAFTVTVVPGAAAEITVGPTSDWGVEGLATGSQTDTILSSVFAIEQIGDRIYIGGRFTDVTNEGSTFARPYIAAFDAVTGDWISSFAPTLDAPVIALEASPDGSRLFVGGAFNNANGQAANSFVALDPITGATDTTWASTLTNASVVRNFDLVGNWLYVVGSFNGVSSPGGSASPIRAARFDWQSGDHDPSWLPEVQGGSIWGVAASSTSDQVYLAGEFLTVNQVSVSVASPP